MKIELSGRLKKLPPYLFAEIDRVKRELLAEGKKLIDLGVGDPDQPTPNRIVEELCRGAKIPSSHRYALDFGMSELREATGAWYKRRFNVDLDPDREILPLLGAKEGIAHIPLAFINPGDVVLIPNPAYPVYQSGTIFAGGKPVFMPLLERNGFLPELEAIDEKVARKAKLMFLNYPNNPTAAVCDLQFFEQVVAFARKYGIIVCHDAAYTELAFNGYSAPSFLQVEGAQEVGMEFHSLSKTYNMTGWRVGFAVGNEEVIQGLTQVKSNIDSGIFRAVQIAAVQALNGPQDFRKEMIELYQRRRDILVDGLTSLGWKVKKPKATFYVWCPTPKGYGSMAFTELLLEKAGIVTTPGVGLGKYGEGYIRMALTISKEEIVQAIERLKSLELDWSPP